MFFLKKKQKTEFYCPTSKICWLPFSRLRSWVSLHWAGKQHLGGGEKSWMKRGWLERKTWCCHAFNKVAKQTNGSLPSSISLHKPCPPPPEASLNSYKMFHGNPRPVTLAPTQGCSLLPWGPHGPRSSLLSSLLHPGFQPPPLASVWHPLLPVSRSSITSQSLLRWVRRPFLCPPQSLVDICLKHQLCCLLFIICLFGHFFTSCLFN